MRLPRLGFSVRLRIQFQTFLLLTMLASLIAASAAIRTRLAVQEFSEDHAFRAYQARGLAESWERSIRWADGMEKSSVNAADKARYRTHIRFVRSEQAKAAAEADRQEGLVRYYEAVAPR
jgi:hypothetical protein